MADYAGRKTMLSIKMTDKIRQGKKMLGNNY